MRTAACLIIFGALVSSSCAGQPSPDSVKTPELRAQLKSFAAEKESQARSLASAAGKPLPPEVEELFSAVENSHWEVTSNDFFELKKRISADESLYGSWWQPVLEAYGAAEQFTLGDEKYAAAYGFDIIQSVPPGSIYFGGTDPGRFIVTAMEKSQINGEPFFVLSQNPLSDNSYLGYLRTVYGNKISIPSTADLQKRFDDYYRDYQVRRAGHQLLAGEDVTNGPDGRMRINSHMSDIQIYSALAKLTFEQNTSREFYVEESFHLEWMYPNLEPYGLIFKLNREPKTTLSRKTVEEDRNYWMKASTPMIGSWLIVGTSVQDVAAFVERLYLHHDYNNFTGDPAFLENRYSQQMFSKDRASIAGLYAWRAQHDTDAADKRSMADAADFAFRQSWALCPDSPETVFAYAQFLMTENRSSDALAVAETAAKFRSGPAAASLDQLVSFLKHH